MSRSCVLTASATLGWTLSGLQDHTIRQFARSFVLDCIAQPIQCCTISRTIDIVSRFIVAAPRFVLGHNCRQEVVTHIVILDEWSQSSTEPLRLLAVVQKLGDPCCTQKPITEKIMNYAMNRTMTDVTLSASSSMLIHRFCRISSSTCAIVLEVIARWLWTGLGSSLQLSRPSLKCLLQSFTVTNEM
ncbi:hypothetical protein TNIN_388801 [Trichonephila inaurata madagascariensis]|uniref:Uncharacterized protein n=1 Tax=Trichonephila inaurata madagascariensis TaxID=2747483 RepID=A0A8X6JT20_9ARAC|nr:hypothetical protein TNIN_388801 [Trichonephila inaurata madagascariensis]